MEIFHLLFLINLLAIVLDIQKHHMSIRHRPLIMRMMMYTTGLTGVMEQTVDGLDPIPQEQLVLHIILGVALAHIR